MGDGQRLKDQPSKSKGPKRSLFDGFEQFYRPDESQEKELLESGLVVFDSNVLLNLYKFSKVPLDQFLNALARLSGRAWIPHQVALEYHGRREKSLKEIVGPSKKIDDSWSKIKKNISEMSDEMASPFDVSSLKELIDGVDGRLQGELHKQYEFVADRTESDPILPVLQGYLDVGPEPDDTRIRSIVSEGEKRYKNSQPPGFLDASKEDEKKPNYYWRGFTIPRQYGDLFLWKQLIDKSKELAEVRPSKILFVTNDKTEDWWRKNGKDNLLGPRRELIQEIRCDGKCDLFWMYSMERFLERAGAVFNIETKAAAKAAAKAAVAVVTGVPAGRVYSNQSAVTDYSTSPDEDPNVKNAWRAWKERTGQCDLRLTLRKRNRLRKLCFDHGVRNVLHGILYWSESWFRYDENERIDPGSISEVWDALHEIICTEGEGWEPPPVSSVQSHSENDFDISDIPF